jgi:iron uptake system component EfeO
MNRKKFARKVAFARGISLLILTCSGAHVAHPATTAISGTAQLDSAAMSFKPYVLEQIDASLAATKAMRDCIAAGDLAGAQKAWLAARDGWERSEIIAAELFPDLDRAIDAWPDARKGFHAIEARLFGAHNVDALGAAEELVGNLADFERQLRATTLHAQALLNGSTRLLYEVGEDKAGGGESPFSGNSLQEIVSNAAAITATYEIVFAQSVRRKNVPLATLMAGDLARLRQLVGVPSLKQLDAAQLRDLTETLTSSFIAAGQDLGLKAPELGN